MKVDADDVAEKAKPKAAEIGEEVKDLYSDTVEKFRKKDGAKEA